MSAQAEDEAAARVLMVERYGWDASKMDPAAFRLFARHIATAREQGRQAKTACEHCSALLRPGEMCQAAVEEAAEGWMEECKHAEERGRQAGAEEMREACAKWADTRPTYRCEDCGHEGRVVERSSCCGDQCPKCGGSPERIVVDGALVRALPLPEPSR